MRSFPDRRIVLNGLKPHPPDPLRQAMDLPQCALDLPRRAKELPPGAMHLPQCAMELLAAAAGPASARTGPAAAVVVHRKLLIAGRLATTSKVLRHLAATGHHQR